MFTVIKTAKMGGVQGERGMKKPNPPRGNHAARRVLCAIGVKLSFIL